MAFDSIMIGSTCCRVELWMLQAGRGILKESEYVFVDVLVETKECSFLYCGVLEEFYFDKDALDRLVMSQVFRRKVVEDPAKDTKPEAKAFGKRYYQMPGDLFVLPFSQVRNSNLTYYRLQPVSDVPIQS